MVLETPFKSISRKQGEGDAEASSPQLRRCASPGCADVSEDITSRGRHSAPGPQLEGQELQPPENSITGAGPVPHWGSSLSGRDEAVSPSPSGLPLLRRSLV